MSTVSIKNIRKEFDDVVALKKINLEIEDEEFFTLLGPSGCGKSTLLKTLAGFHRQEKGSIAVGGQKYDSIPAHKRDMGMVFQNYAIFPHLSVFENVAYGLKAKKLPKDEIKKRVEESLDLVHLKDYSERFPNQLSGGQQQRVVLSRAIVTEPEVLLMDEPLSNLDAKLRRDMQSVIRHLQQTLKITTIYVTHDQQEALSISDRIAVMDVGEVKQVGNPVEIYKNPDNIFVADFIGTSNFISGKITKKENNKSVIELEQGNKFSLQLDNGKLGQEVEVCIRPEHIDIVNKETENNQNMLLLDGDIYTVRYLGAESIVDLKVKGIDGTFIFHSDLIPEDLKDVDKLTVSAATENILVFDKETERRML